MAREIAKPNERSGPAPMDPFAAMRAEMDRVFDSFLTGKSGRIPSLFTSDEGVASLPNIDIRENGTEVVIEAELPGMKDEDVDVELRNGMLTIRGEKKIEEEKKEDDYHLTERRYGSFQRSFRVPEGIDEGKIDASLENGVLHIALPKKDGTSAKPRKISVAPK